jgi:putative Mn2+ efflux pump MntP
MFAALSLSFWVLLITKLLGKLLYVTTQDFIKFWGKIFAFVLLEMIGNAQGFKTF